MVFGRTKRVVLRGWLALIATWGVLAAGPSSAPAQDVAAATHDITGADDFRLRVSAALLLGKSRPEGARPLLEQALSDTHPAVRLAAAAALAAYGDPAAIVPLQRHADDASASVRAQIQTSVAALRKGRPESTASWQNARYVVQLGNMKNGAGIRGEQPSGVLRSAARAHAAALPGAVVTDGPSPELLVEAAHRHVPVLALDGSIQRLTRGQKDRDLLVMAEVEFSLRRMPEQSLKGTLSGSATSIGSTSALANPAIVLQLENQAIDGAVESAMRDAAPGFEKAAK
jgi:HEAT repeat protein